MATAKQINFIKKLENNSLYSAKDTMKANDIPEKDIEDLSSGEASVLIDCLHETQRRPNKTRKAKPQTRNNTGKATSKQRSYAATLLARFSGSDYHDAFDFEKPSEAELSEMTVRQMSELISDLKNAL